MTSTFSSAESGTATQDHVPVLMYHSISDRATPKFRTFVLEPAVFSDHMAALVDAGYRPTTLSGSLRSAQHRQPHDGRRPLVLTFDDGFLDFHTVVLPILENYGFPATLYVPTAYVAGTSLWLAREGEADRPIMSWSALLEAAATGIEIGSHSQSHPQLDLISRERLRAEVVDSKRKLEDELQHGVESFAYPFGYFDAVVRSTVAAAGYGSACAVRDLSAAPHDPFAISRFTVRNGMDAQALIETLEKRTGRLPALISDAKSTASRLLRRAGLKHRGLLEPKDRV